jgi:pimeloyl-ACP methyl ester carboxylesterase
VEGLVICGAVAAPSSRYRWIVKSWRTVLEEGGLPTLVWAALPWLFGGTFLEENSRTIPGMVKAMVRRNSAAALAAHLKAIIGYGPLGDLAEMIRCPVTVMAGMEDLLTPSDGAEKLARAYNGRFIPIPETGHSLPAEAPGALLDALDESLMSYGVNSTTISS